MVWARQNDRDGPEHQSLIDTPTIGGPGPISLSSSSPTLLSPSLPLSLQSLPSDPASTDTVAFPTSSDTGGSGSTTDPITISSTGAVPVPSQSQGMPGSSAPSWTFLTPANAVTCQPYRIQWSVSNPAASSTDLTTTDIDIYVTNPGLNLTLVTNQHILNNTYTWPAATLPAGTYTVQGIATGGQATALANPAQYYTLSVKNGSDTSCLSSTGNSSTPGQLASTPKSTNTAAIAGGTIGGIVLVAFAGIALWILCRIRRESRGQGRAHGRGVHALGNKDWNGLSSVDSKFPLDHGGGSDSGLAAGIAGVGAQHGAQQHDAHNVAPTGTRRSRPVSRDLDSTSSLEGEKVATAKEVIAARDAAASATVGLPVLTRNGSWGATANRNAPETDSTAGHGAYDPRSVELAYMPSRPSTGATAHSQPTTAGAPSASASSPRGSLDLTSDPFASPPIANNYNNRRSSRTPRKPVPAYDPAEEEETEGRERSRTRWSGSHVASASGSTSPSPSSSPFGYPPSPLAYAVSQQQQHPADAAALLHGEVLLHGLKSKASGQFEGQAVHYLIPDMPPPPPMD